MILFYAILLWFDSMMMVPCGPKHVGTFNVILQYKSLEQACEFCWFNVVNVVTIIHGMKNINNCYSGLWNYAWVRSVKTHDILKTKNVLLISVLHVTYCVHCNLVL